MYVAQVKVWGPNTRHINQEYDGSEYTNYSFCQKSIMVTIEIDIKFSSKSPK